MLAGYDASEAMGGSKYTYTNLTIDAATLLLDTSYTTSTYLGTYSYLLFEQWSYSDLYKDCMPMFSSSIVNLIKLYTSKS